MSNLQDPSNLDREKELDKLFQNAPIDTEMMVELPSKGKFYKGFVGVKVVPLLFEDEQKILFSKKKNSDPTNEILAKCVQGISIKDLLEMDKLHLLLKIKEISYGPDYSFSVICPKCEANTDVTIDVSKHIPVNFIPDDLPDPREVELPVLKVKCVVRFPRVSEESYFADVDTAIKNLYRFVISLDGKEDPVFIAKAIQKMHIRDLKTITKEVHRSEFGADPSFQFECPTCKHLAVMGVPLDSRFFSLS